MCKYYSIYFTLFSTKPWPEIHPESSIVWVFGSCLVGWLVRLALAVWLAAFFSISNKFHEIELDFVTCQLLDIIYK